MPQNYTRKKKGHARRTHRPVLRPSDYRLEILSDTQTDPIELVLHTGLIEYGIRNYELHQQPWRLLPSTGQWPDAKTKTENGKPGLA